MFVYDCVCVEYCVCGICDCAFMCGMCECVYVYVSVCIVYVYLCASVNVYMGVCV